MSGSTAGVVQQLAPWRRGIGWPIVALQAAIIAILGLFLLLAPDTAQSTARALIGLILLVRSIHVTLDELSAEEHPQPASTLRMLGTGASLATGVIVVLQPFAENITNRGATTILATGLLLIGIVDLIGFILGRSSMGGIKWADLLKPVVTIALALALYYNLRNDRLDFTLIGWVLLVLGAVLGAYAYYIYRSTASVAPEPSTAPGAGEAFGVAAPSNSDVDAAADAMAEPSEATPQPIVVVPSTAAELEPAGGEDDER